MTNALVVGFGRAGKRHAQQLDSLDIEWSIVESNWRQIPDFNNMRYANIPNIYYPLSPDLFTIETFDFAVIATPPDLHLEQIRQCLDTGLPVLCEKPLCALGQLAEAEALLDHPNADKVMVSYNYRYSPTLKQLLTRQETPDLMYCSQYRQLPAWGLLLDHVSHDLDILRWLTGGIDEILLAKHTTTTEAESWRVLMRVGSKCIYLDEEVVTQPGARRTATLAYTDTLETVDIDPDPVMFTDMWQAFLNGSYYPNLKEAIETQKLLEECYKKDVSNQLEN
jgi:predicted dehydrogenase